MQQKDNLQFIAGLITFLLVVFVCAVLIKSAFFDSPAGEPQNSYIQKQHLAGCGDTVLRTCTVNVDIVGSCSEDTAKRQIEGRLQNPLELDDCKRAQELLIQGCPEGCVLDYGSLISVPGKVAFDFFPTPDESGRCQAKGKRSMRMRALCVKK